MEKGRREAVIVAALALAGLVLRAFAARGDLWFDEVWSLELMHRATSALGVFTQIHHDNCHPLNTLWLFLLGDRASFFLYRLPSVAAGTAGVAAAALLAGRRGRVQGAVAAALAAVSSLMVQYGSEARGYAMAVLFALLAYACLPGPGEGPGRPWGFALGVTLSTLSHLSGAAFWAALVPGLAVRLARRRGDGAARLAAAWLGAPAALLGLLWLVDLRLMTIGGGGERPLGATLRDALALTLGGPDQAPLATPVAAVALVVFAAGGLLLARRDRIAALDHAAIVLLPVLGAAILRPPVLQVRYFLIPAAFCLLLQAEAVAALLAKGPVLRAAGGVLLVASLAGNLWLDSRLVRVGRGHYGEAVRYLFDASRAPVVTVGTAELFHDRRLLGFYGRRDPAPRPIALFERTKREWPAGGPEFYLESGRSSAWTPRPELRTSTGELYRMGRLFPAAGLSGWSWAVYRNAAFGPP